MNSQSPCLRDARGHPDATIWLVAWSVNQDNHAILRGKWIRERLLGNVVPDIPITVDAQPEAPEKTFANAWPSRVTYCWQCHKLMNVSVRRLKTMTTSPLAYWNSGTP